ncbi:hypothetical protein, conserved [Leishmania tarentolae]|uniref:Ribosomal RNA methyltransferase FtsJ domain-containing protein n=1 Tax=Leishmania tarentolae TaxID=5689 RepID=A0A640KJS6_LEITA|nr:hypothetical protein, conserved [Leishmania tarentolae]
MSSTIAVSMSGSLELPAPTTAAVTEGDISTALYLTAHRWRSYLLEHSVVFRRLQEERERGWKSAALDEWYARRQADATPSPVTGTTVASPFQPASKMTVKCESHAEKCTTAFVSADVTLLAERYRQHARRITQHAASSFFRAVPKVSSSGSSNADVSPVPSAPLFLDLGCAPGGVSKYLVEDLGWRGVGVTLPSADGGIEVDRALLQKSMGNGASFVLLDGDVTQPPRTWNRSLAYVRVEGEGCARELHSKAAFHASAAACARNVLPPSALLFRSNAAEEPRFHFVNGGAVIDYGQRRRLHRADEAALIPYSVPHGGVRLDTNAGSEADYGDSSLTNSSPSTCAQTPAPILPWFSLLVPQLKTALEYVDAGGALMLVHGCPNCASMFILMRCMEEVVGAALATPSSTSRGCVHVMETMHLAKAPVYLLWTHVRRPRKDSSDSVEARTMQDAQTCLLEALSSTSPRISPLCRTSSSTSPIAATDDSRALLCEKQRLWLGESDEGFELAVEGFQRYGHLVEAVWERMTAFLRQRRERAERDRHNVGGGTRYDRRAAPSAGLKRMRSDG